MLFVVEKSGFQLDSQHTIFVAFGREDPFEMRFKLRGIGKADRLPLPISALADQIVSAREIWGREGEQIPDMLSQVPDALSRVKIVERFLLRQLIRNQGDDIKPWIRYVLQRKGRIRVNRMAETLGVSQRTLLRTLVL